MPAEVEVLTVSSRILAAVRRELPASEIGSAWKPALDQVWAFLRAHPDLWDGGHNVFIYRSGATPGLTVCDFGVEVTHAFEPAGEVRSTETPAGEVALVVHRGLYDRMNEGYQAIDRWMSANQRKSGGSTWEIYSDPTPDPADTETTIARLLA
ncbi:GyrI-like domain-containing protein [Microbacterium candidum]|uniref:GyrI-like domain-containing protein n=1 Tax=Microbacterium candidum TaxID=3041922 RepID=A0ABT7MUV4_9MICO|nr:GyrI-like domain-containing protein [Microbacterium sp. ASV49]MDL9978232.1 GyrI-like domain-containing protein [Microbacterium sp. ASV49]